MALAVGAIPAAAQQPTTATPPSSTTSPKISGYLQARETWQPDIGLTGSINRARITVTGGIATDFAWRVQGEFRTGSVGTNKASVSLQDAYIRYNHAAVGVQVGQFKTPFTREFVTSLADVETADRSTVVDSLAPKRDIGVMADYAIAKKATFAAGLFNGDGQNVTANKDSTLLGVARLVIRPIRSIALGVNAARYFGDSTRYGGDLNYEDKKLTLRAEYVGQYRDGTGQKDDKGWFGLGAYRAADCLQLVGKYEQFARDGVSLQQKNRAWTAGGNIFLAGQAMRLTLEYVSRSIGDPGSRKGMILTQLQARF